MTPNFSNAVDPVFECLLDLFDRVEKGQPVEAADEQNRIVTAFGQAQAKLGQSKDWEYASYALACWADEILVTQPWSGQDWWVGNPLEVKLFGTADGAVRFFTMGLTEATSTDKRDALEVFFLCVVLGFRGLYESPNLGGMIKDYQLPDSLEAWIRRAIGGISPPRDSDVDEFGELGPGAPARMGGSWMVSSLVCSVLLFAALLLLWLANMFDGGSP